ncbi:unnamed protein product [Notodromas monacha]|uniref:Uncharacterized protein n=1 Tax=Notodromas monacha TaxID=399045 RepID=A0A7R9BKH5_9CRUS|nr:unnamed protein product [Notodromas monacha]CAG0916059.1 unnamed protein product [Notodromas monacha]
MSTPEGSCALCLAKLAALCSALAKSMAPPPVKDTFSFTDPWKPPPGSASTSPTMSEDRNKLFQANHGADLTERF